MKFSFTLMNAYRTDEAIAQNFAHPPRSMWNAEYGVQMFQEALELAEVADQEGFDIVTVSEHHYQPGMVNPNPAVTAAALAGVVKQAKIAMLGPLVSMTNPIRIAEEIAQLDQITGGRLIVAPLRGTPNEFQYYNVDPAETRERTEEATELILKCLTEPEQFSWKSKHYDFPFISVWPGPTQTPHPPMFYSANSAESAAFAAKHQLGAACSYAGVQLVAERMAYYREQCAEQGWTPSADQQLLRAFCIVGEDDSHVADLEARFELKPTTNRSRAAESDHDKALAFGLLQFSGTSEQLVEQLREHHERTGVGVYDFSFNGGYFSQEETVEQIRRFAREVIPALREVEVASA